MKEAVTITTRRTSGADYQYYARVSFKNIEYAAVDSNADGGAIYGSSITLSNNGSVKFSGNTASSADSCCYGGAICGWGDTSIIALNNNGSVKFIGNMASSAPSFSEGGAICGGGTIMLNNNGSVEFIGNTASSAPSASYGGAIYGGGTITLNNNGSVKFIGNTASYSGGAICGWGDITLSNNDCVMFSGNTVSGSGDEIRGGAIYRGSDSTVMLSNNGKVSFIENTASGYQASGGAIYTSGSLHIRNNDSVEFSGNVEKEGSAYRLRSVYVSGGSDDVLNISAAAGKSVTFYDTIYVGSGTTVNLNADYEDAEGNIIEQKGDIIFTGATTVADLYKAKGNVAGTAMEILNSRTTEVRTMTNLYGGRLRMEDGAIYQGYGITVHEGSVATVLVKDATLSHSGYDLIFNAGTTLELVGDSQLAGNLMMLTGSILSLDSTMNLNGSLTLGNEVVLGGALLDDILSMKAGDTLTLVSGLESLHLQTQSLMRSLEYTTLLSGELVNASDYFENLKEHSDLVFCYDSNTQTLKIIYAIPEPATTTLSLLALAALAARRRRK